VFSTPATFFEVTNQSKSGKNRPLMLRASAILLLCGQMAGFTVAQTITPSSRLAAFEELHTFPVQSEPAGVFPALSNASFASTKETDGEEQARTESNQAVSTADQALDVSLEPVSANLRPTVPLNLLKGAKRGQPFNFTYEQLIAGPPTDPEQDPLSDLRVYPSSLPLTLNGTPVTASGAVIRPGDVFGTMPGPTAVGNVPLLTVIVRDPWSSYAPTAFMRVETPFEEWVQLHFTPGESANPAISGPNADPDGDGTSNVFEFLNSRLPKAVASSIMVRFLRTRRAL
jgi:hypothetical protein